MTRRSMKELRAMLLHQCDAQSHSTRLDGSMALHNTLELSAYFRYAANISSKS